MATQIKNNAEGILASSISNTDTTLTLNVGQGSLFPVLGVGDITRVTLIDQSDDTLFEIVEVTDITGDVFTIVRGQEGTTARNFNASDLVELRITRQTILDLLSGGSPPERKVYDTIPAPIGGASYPLDSTTMMERYLSINRDNLFSKLKFEHKNITTNVVTSDLTFNNISQLDAWVNNNVSNDGSDFTESGVFSMYDEVDLSIPTFSSGYGYNSVFSSMTSNKYKSHNGVVTDCSYYNEIYADAFNTMNPNFSLVASDFNSLNARATVWLPKTSANYNKGLVTTSHWSNWIEFTSGYNGARYYFEEATNTPVAVNIGSDMRWKAIKTRLYSVDNTNNFTSYDITHSNRTQFAKDIHIDSRRYITAYLLQSTSNSKRYSIMFKPNGIDTLSIEYVDYNIYDLEVISMNRTNAFAIQNTITSNSYQDDDSGRQQLHIDKWNITKSVTKYNPLHMSSQRYYFRLRNKATNKVGKLSNFYIYNFGLKKYNSRNTFGYLIGSDTK